jgi:hypothetical protein
MSNVTKYSDFALAVFGGILLVWKRTSRMLSVIVRVVRTISTVLKWRKIMVEFDKKSAFAPEVKAALVSALKESQEFIVFIEHVEEIVVVHLTDKCGDSWLKELMQIATEVAMNLREEMMAAFAGVAGIPAEWKAAPKGAWVEFAIQFLMAEGKILSAIWKKPTV